MAFIDGPDLSAFKRLAEGIHDFDETEMARLHAAAQEVKAVLDSADARDEEERMARNPFRQMGH